MEYRNLGQSGLKVSTLCLGTMTFGEADERSMMHKVGCDEDTSHQLIERALEAGINFFDTANIYGQDGLSERVIGAWSGVVGGDQVLRLWDEVSLAQELRRIDPSAGVDEALTLTVIPAQERYGHAFKTGEAGGDAELWVAVQGGGCLLYTSPSPRD